MRWEVAAEAMTLAAGLALAWPALRLNQCLRYAHDAGRRAETARSRHVRDLRRGLASAYGSPSWNPLDHGLTLAGVGLLILSSAIRLVLLLHNGAA